MKKILIFSLLFLVSCASEPKKEASDPVVDLLTTLGTMSALDAMVEVTFRSLKESHPGNVRFIDCFKAEYSSAKIVENLRPYYYKIFTRDDLVSLNAFLKTPLGGKFLLLSRNPSLYETSSSYFTESERAELTSHLSAFSKYHNRSTNIALSNATNEVSQRMARDALERCARFKR